MVPDDLKINQLVEVAISSNNQSSEYYKTRVEGISAHSIQLGIPIVNGALLPIHQGDQIQAKYSVKKEYNQVITYSFSSFIRGWEKSPIPVMILDLPDKVNKAQRRSYLRLPVNMVCHWSKPDEDTDQEAAIIDLSGGGCQLKTTETLEEGTEINLRLTVPNKPEIVIKSKIMRVLERQDKKHNYYHCGVEFTEIRENQRDQIVKYLFELQRDSIKNRRI